MIISLCTREGKKQELCCPRYCQFYLSTLNHEIKESIDEIGKGSNPEMWTRKGNNKHNGKGNPPWSSINLKAFSRKDGDPSTSSIASKIGLPMTKDFTGCLSFTTGKKCKNVNILWI